MNSCPFNLIFSYGDLSDELKVINEEKCVASLSQLKILLGCKCRFKKCCADIKTVSHKTVGFCLKLERFCEEDHRGVWYSSPFYAAGLAINYVVHTALILSGGQVNQFRRFVKFGKIGTCSVTSFYENQRLYVSPAVDQEFNEMRNEMLQDLQVNSSNVVACGDGRMDSPGYSATKGTYALMDFESKNLLTMECGDKREVCY